MNRQFVAGGYRLMRPFTGVPAPRSLAHGWPAGRPLSVSTCIVDAVPDTWSVPWASMTESDRRTETRRLGLTPAAARRVTAWTEQQLAAGTFLLPGVLPTVDAAGALVRDCGLGDVGLTLVGAGFTPDTATALHADLTDEGASDFDTDGLARLLADPSPPDPAGIPHGFELLGHDGCGLHSWYCYNGLVDDVTAALGLHVGPDGLQDAGDAARAAAWCNEQPRGNLSTWYPALLVTYQITER